MSTTPHEDEYVERLRRADPAAGATLDAAALREAVDRRAAASAGLAAPDEPRRAGRACGAPRAPGGVAGPRRGGGGGGAGDRGWRRLRDRRDAHEPAP